MLPLLFLLMGHQEYWLAAAVEAAMQAGKVIRKHYQRPLKIREKGSLGLVTNADMEAEAAALKVLRRSESDFAFLTEESYSKGERKSGQEGLWILDPLDGTTNFIHGYPMFCVTVGLELRDRLEVGVTYHPILDELYTAIRGKGAYRNGKRIRVSNTAKIGDALLSTGFVYSARKNLSPEISSFEKVNRASRAVRRPGSAALDLAYTACGVFDGFWERNLSAWDVAAGALLVQEAGGKVTGLKDKSFDPHAAEILASNGKIHSKILKLLK